MKSGKVVLSYSGLIPFETARVRKKRGIALADFKKEEFD